VRLPPFQTFFDRHRDVVYRFLLASVGHQEAADCLQETFIAALRAYPRLPDGAHVRAWILTIAHRKAIDHYRASGRRPVPVETLPDPGVDPPPLPDPTLWEAVNELPPKQRAAIVLRYVSDLPYAQVATVMGGTEAAARQNVRAGLTTLRREWADDA